MPLLTLRSETPAWGTLPSERSLAEHLKYGVIVLDKPAGPTSHEAAAFVRKLLSLKRAGHTGTLDNNVSGVLPVLLEESTKASNFLLKDRKTYVCLMKLSKELPQKDIDEVFDNFRGEIYQTPPLASAVAKKLRTRRVYQLDVLEVDGKRVLFRAEVSAGTYIRNLVFDFGEIAGVESEMTELRRTLSAGLPESEACTLQDVSDAYWLYKERGDEKELRRLVRSLESVVKLKKVVVGDDAIRPISTGAHLAVAGINALDSDIKTGDAVQVLSGKGELICFAKALMDAGEIAKGGKGWAFDAERVLLHAGLPPKPAEGAERRKEAF